MHYGNDMLKVGELTYGHEFIEVLSWGEGSKVIIGKFCSIAHNVKIFLGGNHNPEWVSSYPFGWINQELLGSQKYSGHPRTNGDVIIEDDVWIGYGSTIMSGVTIGCGAVVAANSHVVTNIPSYEIWGGNPARLIRKRFGPEIIEKLIEIKWWNHPIEKILEIKQYLCIPLSLETIDQIERILKH